MFFKQMSVMDIDVLDRIAGITGIGWTVSILSYLATIIGYGNSLVTRLTVDPQSLLYIGGALFVATFGLDRLRNKLSSTER